MFKPNRRNGGNVLFLILIAVALFAALSYAVTQSSRTGTSDSSKDSAKTTASEILQYAALIKQETDRLRVVNGAAQNEIDYYTTFTHMCTGTAVGPVKNRNTNCTPAKNPKCSVFKDNGGQIQGRDFSVAAQGGKGCVANGHPAPGEFTVFNNFVEGVGTEDYSETVMYITGLNQQVCDAIDDLLGLPAASTQPVTAWDTTGERYFWNETADYTKRLPGAATAYAGQSTFCINHQTYGYIFVHVLMPR